MHGIAGTLIWMTLAGGAVNFKLQGWRIRESVSTQRDTGPGDLYESRLAGIADYEVEFMALVPDQTARHIFAANEASMGTEVAFGLKEKTTDTNPVKTGTALVVELELDASDFDRPIQARGRMQCSQGVVGAWDTTPLT